MEIDRNGLEVLERDEALALVRSAAVGRLAIHAGALPAIVPVNFALTRHGIVIRTGAGSKLQQATDNAVVAFEVDEHDPLAHTGWSVNVVGIAREVTDEATLAELRRIALAHWAPGEATHFVVLSLDVVTGRRIGRAPVRAGAPAS